MKIHQKALKTQVLQEALKIRLIKTCTCATFEKKNASATETFENFDPHKGY